MTQIFNLRNALAAAFLAAAASVSLFSASGTASASVLECKGNTPGAVMACCQQEVKRYGGPMWMRVNQQSCNVKEVRCSKQDRRCWYKPSTFVQNGNNDKDSRGGNNGRGQNGKR